MAKPVPVQLPLGLMKVDMVVFQPLDPNLEKAFADADTILLFSVRVSIRVGVTVLVSERVK